MPTTARSSQTLKRLPVVATASAAQVRAFVPVRADISSVKHKSNIFQAYTPVA